WAKWLNTLIPPSIGVAQDDSSEGRVWQAGMNSVSQGLNSIDNAISAASADTLDALAAAAESSEEDSSSSPIGAFCNSNEDCSPNGICRTIGNEDGVTEKICVARDEAEPTPTQKIGDRCSNNGECIDGICQNQFCRCSHEGESVGCQSSDTYCANVGEVCVDKKEELGDCSHNYECLNNLCTENGCSIYCGSSADCASNKRCNIEIDLSAGTCPNNMYPCGFCGPILEPKKLGGASCSNHNECSSSICLDGKCICNAVGSASCGTDKYCATVGQTCAIKKLGGASCSNNYECSNNCLNGKCTCNVAGSTSCETGKYCVNIGQPCIYQKAGGAICSNNDECSSDNCLNSKCTCNAVGSASCGTGKYCATAGQACVNKKFESQTCTANYECLNNQCVSGQCKPEYDVDDGYNVN
ncbi:MAG: hypothetical protein KJ939_02225, partial [Nanoarchaeota archaeon]|nr:hypothetical protein [Nanoarchaeota archaeon]